MQCALVGLVITVFSSFWQEMLAHQAVTQQLGDRAATILSRKPSIGGPARAATEASKSHQPDPPQTVGHVEAWWQRNVYM